jgi:hypothetical protein
LCILAVFAFSAVATATASASNDEWEVCEKGGTEKFEEHKCSKKSTGGEWSWKVLAAGKSYNVVSNNVAGVNSVLTVGTKVITCTGVTDTGTITGGKPGTDLVTEAVFTGCTTSTTGCAVHSPGQPNGTIKLKLKLPTKLEQRKTSLGAEVLADNFEGGAEFVTLEFSGETCKAAGFVTTKVTEAIAAEVKNLANGEVELNFPEPELMGNTLKAFGVAAKFKARIEVSLENGWSLRAS